MINSVGKVCTVLVLALLVLTAGVTAAAPISTIAPGNTVFLGEEGLDIAAALGPDSRIGWWASAASVETSSPSYTISVADPSNFFISPTEFSGRLGPWYRIDESGKADGVVFTVADPNLDLRVEDVTAGYDATNGWIPMGDEVQFRITTNLYQITQRDGVSAVPMTIYVKSPDGATFSALINKAGTATPLIDMPVTTSPWSTGPIWDTSRRDTYTFGSYMIWAECNVNSMKDNYKVVGRTVSANAGMLYQEVNPLIYMNTRTTAATPVPTSAVTTVPPATTVVTTVPATVTTPATVVTTAPATATPTAPPATVATATTAKSPGFAFMPAGAALLLMALAWSVRKE
jgi:hypothetical protein